MRLMKYPLPSEHYVLWEREELRRVDDPETRQPTPDEQQHRQPATRYQQAVSTYASYHERSEVGRLFRPWGLRLAGTDREVPDAQRRQDPGTAMTNDGGQRMFTFELSDIGDDDY